MAEEESPQQLPLLPVLETLHQRHVGLTPEFCVAIAQAARVCMSRYYASPQTLRITVRAGAEGEYLVNWNGPTQQEELTWANREDATRDGAYSVALAAIEVHLGFVTVGRTASRSGADWYVAPIGTPATDEIGELNLEPALRLEVSGIDRCESEAALAYRLSRKLDQIRAAGPEPAGIASVVAFDIRRVAFAYA